MCNAEFYYIILNMRIFNFFNRICAYFKIRYFKNTQKYLLSMMSVFCHIDYPRRYIIIKNKLNNLTNDKELINNTEMLDKLLLEHNSDIDEIIKGFDYNIENNSIRYICDNFDAYDLEKIEGINKITFELNRYKVPASFEKKDKYFLYSLELGKLIDNYQKVKSQHDLINEVSNLINNLPEKYIDAREGKKIFDLLNSKISQINKFGDYYYKTPIVKDNIIEIHNQNFIMNHINDAIFDNINGKSLDYEQRRAVLCDSISNLTIAGAGAGKTLTICGKVKWLIEKCGINPEDILLLSYSKASADDLEKKVSQIIPNLTVKTFHALGLNILSDSKGVKLTVEDQFKSYIKKYFDSVIVNDLQMAQVLFEFLTLYLYTNTIDDKVYEDEGAKFEDLKNLNYKTLKDRLASLSDEQSFETIQKEHVKSYQELVIANWLYINGINYQYEKAYEIDTSTIDKRQYTPDFYLPDYKIYIEHYGIDEFGHASQYSEAEQKKYLDGMVWKRNIHKEYNTNCIETYSYNFTQGNIFDILKTKLEANGVKFKYLSSREIYDSINTIFVGQDFNSLMNLIITFISLYKAQYSDESYFDSLYNFPFNSEYEKLRARQFLKICKSIYLFYTNEVKAQGKIDFDDMILKSIKQLDKLDGYKYKYIIVDEFQDISQSRKRFLLKLIKHGQSKLFAVGDDWQAIYRFAGCDIDIFLKFSDIFEDTKTNYITTTHRNSAQLQGIIEPFITANPEQYKKHIQSNIYQNNPVRIIFHKNNRKQAFLKALDNISKQNNNAKVLVLGRNRHDIDCIIGQDIEMINYDEIISNKYKDMTITYKTVHQSKGLESDYVILISGEDAKNGFPNKMEDDQLLEMVLGHKSEFLYGEERRLFYVAITRTRSIVYILSDKNNISEFVSEIQLRSDIENPELLNEDSATEKFLCPWCKSGKLILRDSAFDKTKFYGCSNYPYCNYSINDLKAVKTNNRCPICNDFLVIRNGVNGKFIGCHNYPRCTHTRQLKDSIY